MSAPDYQSATPRLRDGTTPAELQLLDATERLLETTSARDVSVEQILKAAKISRGTFYHYFTSKWDVINKLAATVMADIYTRIDFYVAPEDDAPHREILESSIEEGVKIWAAHRPLIRAMMEHWREVPEIRSMWLEAFSHMIDGVAARIEIERRNGTAAKGADSRQLATAVLWSTAQILYISGLEEIADIPDEDAARALLLQLWIGTIYGLPSDG